MSTRHDSLARDLLVGAVAGVIATKVAGWSEQLASRLISQEQKRRDRLVRQASAHELAGPTAYEKITHHVPDPRQRRWAQKVFSVAYGVGWGLIYAAFRRRYPGLGRLAGLPFAAPFFVACDGVIAPLLRIGPTLNKIPWQMNAKELFNHVTWTAAVEQAGRRAGWRLAA